MILSTLIIIVTVLVLYNYVQCLITLKKSKLDSLPLIPLIGHTHYIFGPNHVFTEKILKLLDKFKLKSFGFYIGPFLTPLFWDIENVSYLFKHEKQNMSKKAIQYEFLRETAERSIFITRGTAYKESKRVLLEAMRHANIKGYLNSFHRNAKNLVKNLETKPENLEFDLTKELNFCAISILLDTVMGLESSIVTREEIEAFAKNFSKCLKYIVYRGYSIWLYPDFIYKRSKLCKLANKAKHDVRNMCRRMILARRNIYEEIKNGKLEKSEETSVFVDKYFESKKEDGDDFAIEDIIDDVFSVIGAGFETTVASLGFALMLLAIHQDVQQKLYEEINSRMQNDQDLSMGDFNELKYLDQVLQETWRLYPPVPALGRSITKDTILPNGGHLRNGTNVWFIVIKMHQNPDFYPNPTVFNPDNFLPERVTERPSDVYIPFGFGTRKCLGINFAKLVIKAILCHSLKNYSFHTTKTQEDFRISYDVTLKNLTGFPVSIKPRNKI